MPVLRRPFCHEQGDAKGGDSGTGAELAITMSVQSWSASVLGSRQVQWRVSRCRKAVRNFFLYSSFK